MTMLAPRRSARVALPLSPAQVEAFHRDGYLVLRGFYELRTEIEPIQWAVHRLIGILVEKHGVSVRQVPFAVGRFDWGYQDLIAHERQIGGELYDAVKQIPAFVRLVASPRHEALVAQLRATDLAGIAAAGYGIRIDNPHEQQYRTNWHQDYPAQRRSLDGIVFWSPLLAMNQELGPVQLCPGSHKKGLVRVHTSDSRQPDSSGAYGLVLEDEPEQIAGYTPVAPLLEPGDLLMMDFLLLHRSGENRSDRSRWSMQMRYFNFLDPTGIRIGWQGSFAAGINVREVAPELFVHG